MRQELRPLPSLDDLAAEPAHATDLSIDDVELLLSRNMRAQNALLNRLLTLPRSHGAAREDSESDLHQLEAGHVADLLAVPKDFVYDLIRRGDLPSIKVGRCVRVPADRLRERIQGREQDARFLHADSSPALPVKRAPRSRERRSVGPA